MEGVFLCVDGFFGEDTRIRLSHKTRFVYCKLTCFVQTGLRVH
jgi:hypothetical protein